MSLESKGNNVDSQYLSLLLWDEWADENGNLGPIYSKQWRSWTRRDGQPIDQITNTINFLKTNPDSRRLMVSAWNPEDVENMALPPCHTLFQLYVAEGKLSNQLYQRSADMFLGVPFNIASYSLLTIMMAQVTGFKPGELIHTLGDAHIYSNHFDQVKTQLQRDPKALPLIEIDPKVNSIFDFKYEDFKLTGYDPHPPIGGPIAV